MTDVVWEGEDGGIEMWEGSVDLIISRVLYDCRGLRAICTFHSQSHSLPSFWPVGGSVRALCGWGFSC